MQCNFARKTSPLPTISWYKGDKLIGNCTGGQKKICLPPTRGDFVLSYKKLKIKKVDYKKHPGQYKCIQENSVGRDEKSTRISSYGT